MDQNTDFELDLHQVRAVVEVRSPSAANELLADGWILHDIYVSADMRSSFILLRTEEVACARCGGSARLEVTPDAESYRLICQNECF